ncbi:MAG: hypothetical protein AB7S65_02850 [Sulfuricurvum sp.]
MTQVIGARELLRNPSLLRIAPNDTMVIEDKRSHTVLGMYIGAEIAEDFLRFQQKEKLLKSAQKIAASSKEEYEELEGTIDDGL